MSCYHQDRSRCEEILSRLICIIIDFLVIPAMCMTIWNKYIIVHVIMAPGILPPISFGVAILVRLFLLSLRFSLFHIAYIFDRDKVTESYVNHVSGILGNMSMHLLPGSNITHKTTNMLQSTHLHGHNCC